MDPLSVTLAVVSLATAVKDLVELGQKIHESFAKVSNNLRSAQRIAEDIKEMLEEIQVFYEDHRNTLDNMKDFRSALQGLLAKFRNFESSILPLLPQTGGRKGGHLFRGWDAWRNNNKVEGNLSILQNDIVRVMRRYMMRSAMRAEIKLENIHEETSRGLTVISQGLEIVRRDVSALRTTAATTMSHCSHKSLGTNGDDFNHNIIMFAQSTPSSSMPMLRTPDAISEELMTTAYIKFQVNTIVMTLEKMSTPAAFTPNSIVLNDGNFHMSSAWVSMGTISTKRLRHHIVRQITIVHDLLDTKHMQIISINEAAKELTDLSAGLYNLGMHHESMLLGSWIVTIARTLVDASSGGRPQLTATLACYLLNQSMAYESIGDNIQSLRAIEEAHAITKALRNQYGGEVAFEELHSNVLLQYARLVGNQRSIEMTLEAMLVLEGVLDVQAFDQSYETVVRPCPSFLDNLFSSAPTASLIMLYARALRKLGIHLLEDGDPDTALDLARLGIAVHRHAVSIYGDRHRVHLAHALSVFIRCGIADIIPIEEHIGIAEECVQLLRELVETNPVLHVKELRFALWIKATTLEKLNRDSEAITTWEEVASLAGQIALDSLLGAAALDHLVQHFRRLDRHDDAVRAGTLAIATYQEDVETQALRYYHLSKDLQSLQRHRESVEAARKSVELYRRLAMRGSEEWVLDLNQGVSHLAYCLAVSGNYSEALIALKESASMFINLLKPDLNASTTVIRKYLALLGIHIFRVCRILDDEEECLQVIFTTVQYLRQLSEIHSQNADIIHKLIWAEYCYVYNLHRLGRLQDAQQYIENLVDTWSSQPVSGSGIAVWTGALINLKAGILEAQGCTEQALLATHLAHRIVELSVSTHQCSFAEMIASMVHEAKLQMDLGRREEALQVAEEALRLSRDSKLEPISDSLVLSLHGVAITALSCWNYERAVEAAREGYNIADSSKWTLSNETDVIIGPSLLAILSSAEENLGRHTVAIEDANRAVDASLEIGEMKSRISVTTAERSLVDTRGNLAEILLATGEISQAREICQERKAYFSSRVANRMGEYRDLAPILRMLGVLCCNEGRHEEGDAAAKELSEIIKTLGSVFPSLQEQVKIRLRNQAKVPILKILDDMCQKLDCKHQAEVNSLFEL